MKRYDRLKRYKMVLAALFFMSAIINVKAQQLPKVQMIARVDSAGSIHLRWAATDAKVWKLCNQYGFKLERYTVLRNKELLEKPDYKKMGQGIIKAAPLNDWKELAEKDNYAAILAQALYGKDFEVSEANSKELTKIMAQSQELQQRFTFSLYAADLSFNAAKLAGWGITDKETVRYEKYLYRIITAAPANLLKPDTASVFISPSEYDSLPAVDDIAAQFGNKTVMLSWDYARLSSFYTSYFIERSQDNGQTFNRLDGIPVTNMNNKEDQPSSRMFFMDSLSVNGKEFQYRIRGINAFGETGPPSVIVKGQGKEMLAFVPGIKAAYVDDKGILQIKWEFEPAANELIKGFMINRSDKADDGYEPYSDNIPATDRSISLKKALEATNYFTITAIAKEGEGRTSFPVLVQPIDSIPPQVPVGLTALVDSTGKVTLKWKANTEKDLLGYKVYRALKKGEEAVPLIDSVWYATTYEDVLSLKLTNPKAWYGVSALDKRFNQSAISELVELKKPSKIPPSPAVFTKYEVKGDSVILNWINSTDEDIVSHRLLRQANGETTKNVIGVFEGRTTANYTDLKVKQGSYSYFIEVKNEGGLSALSEPLTLSVYQTGSTKREITRLYATPQPDKKRIQIAWDDKLENIAEYQVYKAIKGQPLTLWQTMSKEQKGLYDTNVQPNTEYEYAVMAVFKTGVYSSMKNVKVSY